MMSEPQVLRPFHRSEAIPIAEAARNRREVGSHSSRRVYASRHWTPHWRAVGCLESRLGDVARWRQRSPSCLP